MCETLVISRAARYGARTSVEPTLDSPRARQTPAHDLLVAIEAVVTDHRASGARKVRATLRRSGLRRCGCS